ncbi:hypothetical protein D9C73_024421 [Collichthys lucidus]|uniref:Sterile alpha motif domain-containing protein 3 n=1 Tax=Collichthys lucidus TaxID=240159 RepID=A0A4U5VQR2_COLLU|nr:hypothetical protein D9C73_024421 [Collichthys lucidus]
MIRSYRPTQHQVFRGSVDGQKQDNTEAALQPPAQPTTLPNTQKKDTPDTPGENAEEGPAQCDSMDNFDHVEVESQCDTDTLRAQLHQSLASLFLKMKTILHVSDLATQDIVEHLTQIFSLSQPLVKQSLREVLEHHDISVSENTLDDVVSAVLESNILVNATVKGRELSSTKRRKTFVEKNYPVVKPVEYVLEPGHTAVHVSILDMIQKIFKHTDILDKLQETGSHRKQTSHVSSVLVSGLPDVAKAYVEQMTDSSMIYSTSVVSVDETDYGVEMFVTVGQEGGLPQFSEIEQILLVDNQIVFLCKRHTSYYIEHLRSYELSPGNLTVHLLKELNDTLPLSAYRADGKLLLTPKRTSTHMAAPQKFVLCVCVATDVAMKLILTERPQSVEELKNIMQEKFKPRLDCDFTLQYEDPDFNGQLSVLMDIQELPEKGTLKVVRSESDVSSTGSSGTDILPHVPLRQRQKNWPDCFPVPTFSYEVEHVCAQGNAAFESSGKTLKLTRAQKHNILENMAETMYNFKPYPHDKEVGMAAEALVTAHPCLREHGSKNGWYGWKTTSEEMRVQIIQETEKTERDQILIEKLMHTTFALRRQHIVQGSPQVREFLENWPAFRMQSQVFAEFHRITNVNLRNQFYYELDRYTPKLAALYRQKSSRTGKGAEALREMLRIYDLQEEHDINMRRTLALRALPVYLREDDTEFFKTCNGEDEVEIIDTQLALLSVVPDSIGSISFSPENISIVIEDEVVISELPRLADAFVVLFGLIYALHLDYPKKLTHTFTFIQKVLMCLDDNKPLKPCLLSLKNDLLKE